MEPLTRSYQTQGKDRQQRQGGFLEKGLHLMFSSEVSPAFEMEDGVLLICSSDWRQMYGCPVSASLGLGCKLAPSLLAGESHANSPARALDTSLFHLATHALLSVPFFRPAVRVTPSHLKELSVVSIVLRLNFKDSCHGP